MSFIPFLLVARARLLDSPVPRISVIPDMDKPPRYGSQAEGPFFADGQAMRPEVPGTVARGELREDDAFYRGKLGEAWVKQIPLALDDEVMARGRERFGIYCAPCHGYAGRGDGAVARRRAAVDQRP